MSQKPTHKSTVTLVTKKVASDTGALIVNGADSSPDDAFYGSYTAAGNDSVVSLIEPTFKPGVLEALTTTNNILLQCIDAMVVNVDGTGHTIELIEGATESESEKKILENFFDEPYPNKSMLSIRKELRHDLEATGNGYLECIRNANDDLTLLNYTPAADMRLVRLDAAVPVKRTLERGGREVEVVIRARERRYVQMVNGKKVFFREFMSSRDLDRDTGKWAATGVKLPIDKRASEILHFTVSKEPKTPYGSPRWINQLPSILGSRKAEEFNLEFFDSGGLPPVLVVVQGGYLGTDVKESLQAHLGGKGSKHRAAIVEAISSSGSLDSSGSVKVTVERFGAERMQDAMFQQYDKNAEDHVRVAFRLPPLFTGRAQDYNFATALTGYMIAEAQVFAPERTEFDERMWWLVKALGVKNYIFKSKPLTLSNMDNQLKAMQMAITAKIVDNENAIEELNTLTGLHMEVAEPPPEPEKPEANIDPITNLPYTTPVQPLHPNDPKFLKLSDAAKAPPEPPVKPAKPTLVRAAKTEGVGIVNLASQWANVLGLSGPCLMTDQEVRTIKGEVSTLTGEDLKMFNEILASKTLTGVQSDFEGLAELCGHSTSMGV